MTSDTELETEKILVDSLFQKSMEGLKKKAGEERNILRLTGDASSRRYFRVEANKNYVVCLQQPTDEDKDTFLEIQKIFDKEKIRVPRIYDYDLKKGYLLEEDLGNTTLLKHLSTLSSPNEELNAYRKALEEMIKIHSIPKSDYSMSTFASLFFDKEKLMSEVEFTKAQLIEGLFGQSLTKKQEKVLNHAFSEICQALASQSMVVTHRDYHSRNLMVVNQDFVVIDFQDARMGIPQYDLVSLLEDCYYKISRSNKHILKKEYWENFLKEKHFQASFEEYCILYDKMTIQRVYKALGSFAYIYRMRGDIRYLKYIGYAFEKLRDILFRYKGYNDLRMVLSEIYYEY